MRRSSDPCRIDGVRYYRKCKYRIPVLSLRNLYDRFFEIKRVLKRSKGTQRQIIRRNHLSALLRFSQSNRLVIIKSLFVPKSRLNRVTKLTKVS